MSGRTVAALVFATTLGFWLPAQASAVDCSLPIGRVTAVQFDGCLRAGRDQAKIEPLRIDDFEYLAPKPTTQRAYDDLLHAGY